MRDGQACTISLLCSHLEGPAISYELEVRQRGVKHLITLRYSVLRTIAKLLPNCQVKFPEPNHLTRIVSQITGNDLFFKKRYSQLTAYFEAISKSNELENSLGFSMLISKGSNNCSAIECPSEPPKTPRIKGKKLIAKIIDPAIC